MVINFLEIVSIKNKNGVISTTTINQNCFSKEDLVRLENDKKFADNKKFDVFENGEIYYKYDNEEVKGIVYIPVLNSDYYRFFGYNYKNVMFEEVLKKIMEIKKNKKNIKGKEEGGKEEIGKEEGVKKR